MSGDNPKLVKVEDADTTDMDAESKSDVVLDEVDPDEETDLEPEEKDYDDTNHNP
jgi:hypothetical protein